ncbi:hypothetical protein POM88_048497 [Heracleum sosnowskyi]|uniref:Uncharacterized protein n=1 Tax=Heracleum sosnowskyi TaxID=360622 RepID=A0AAD8GWG0_9APIA|nr:hypothetical protein POM88_048497 [Heracleum sosnowskyi]
MSKDEVVTPHVLIFPLPLQGPVNCMLKVAELFAIKGLRVTFLNTFHIQNLLLKHTNVQFRFDNYPEFHFETIPDGLSEDHPRSSDKLLDLADGPLHALYKSIQLSAEKASPDANFSNSLWEDDKSCMAWYDRVTIEKTVREVMEDKKDEFEKSSSMMAKLARQSVGDQGASSHSHFNRLVEDIRMMRLSTHSS